jgi:hypothetical protein
MPKLTTLYCVATTHTCQCAHAIGDYDSWINPGPKRDFIVTLGFALQRANAKMVRDANLRRRRNRAGERYASSADQSPYSD